MSVLNAKLADISTKVEPVAVGAHRAQIKEVIQGKSKKSSVPMVTITYKINDEDDPYNKRELSDYFTLETKEGEPNEAGLRGLKRVIVAALGEDRANAEDFDTDELKGVDVEIVTIQEPYEDPDTKETSVNSKVKKVVGIK